MLPPRVGSRGNCWLGSSGMGQLSVVRYRLSAIPSWAAEATCEVARFRNLENRVPAEQSVSAAQSGRNFRKRSGRNPLVIIARRRAAKFGVSVYFSASCKRRSGSATGPGEQRYELQKCATVELLNLSSVWGPGVGTRRRGRRWP